MKSQIIRVLLILFMIYLSAVSSVNAAEGGYSNYVPGTYGDFGAAVEPPTKWTIRNDYYNYRADGKRSFRSGLLELDAELEFEIHFLTVLYKPDLKLFGAQYAAGAFIPTVVDLDIESGIEIAQSRVSIKDDVTRFGDATFIPAILYWKDDCYHYSLSEFIVAPTGDYNVNSLANAGLNYWTFDTDFTATYLNEETGQDYSIVLGYNYNTENNETNYKTGQEIHIDYMLNQYISETCAVGLQGFYLKQITGDSGSGSLLGDFKSDAAGIGPALLWSPKRFEGKVSFVAKWFHEYYAKNRIKGDHVFISLIASF